MLIQGVHLQNILSFGPENPPFELRSLNVLIGPNGSGKSNFIDVFGLLRAAPGEITEPIRTGGGFDEWPWKGDRRGEMALAFEVVGRYGGPKVIEHHIGLYWAGITFFVDEEVATRTPPAEAVTVYDTTGASGRPATFAEGVAEELRTSFRFDRSILAQRRDPVRYPEITFLADQYEKIRIYRDWSFGRRTQVRQPQRTDLPTDYLAEDMQNFTLVLNRLFRDPPVKDRMLAALGDLYPGISDVRFDISGGSAHLVLSESVGVIPAARLSDGTLRFLCLLVVLCHPEPPPLICIEEPELGLHPDALLTIAKWIEEASERTQLVITTHSQFLVDYFTHDPEAIVVCEKGELGTTMRRLNRGELEVWLKDYSLGNLWSSGQIGGNRW